MVYKKTRRPEVERQKLDWKVESQKQGTSSRRPEKGNKKQETGRIAIKTIWISNKKREAKILKKQRSWKQAATQKYN